MLQNSLQYEKISDCYTVPRVFLFGIFLIHKKLKGYKYLHQLYLVLFYANKYLYNTSITILPKYSIHFYFKIIDPTLRMKMTFIVLKTIYQSRIKFIRFIS
jgi:hypothetical protein